MVRTRGVVPERTVKAHNQDAVQVGVRRARIATPEGSIHRAAGLSRQATVRGQPTSCMRGITSLMATPGAGPRCMTLSLLCSVVIWKRSSRNLNSQRNLESEKSLSKKERTVARQEKKNETLGMRMTKPLSVLLLLAAKVVAMKKNTWMDGFNQWREGGGLRGLYQTTVQMVFPARKKEIQAFVDAKLAELLEKLMSAQAADSTSCKDGNLPEPSNEHSFADSCARHIDSIKLGEPSQQLGKLSDYDKSVICTRMFQYNKTADSLGKIDEDVRKHNMNALPDSALVEYAKLLREKLNEPELARAQQCMLALPIGHKTLGDYHIVTVTDRLQQAKTWVVNTFGLKQFTKTVDVEESINACKQIILTWQKNLDTQLAFPRNIYQPKRTAARILLENRAEELITILKKIHPHIKYALLDSELTEAANFVRSVNLPGLVKYEKILEKLNKLKETKISTHKNKKLREFASWNPWSKPAEYVALEKRPRKTKSASVASAAPKRHH